MSPALFFFTIAIFLSLCLMVYLSLFETNFINSRFVGIQNYIQVFQDTRFLSVLYNTVLYAVCIVPIQIVFALVVAFHIHAFPKRLQHVARAISYAPLISAGIIISTAWKWIFSPTRGVVNWLLGLVHIAPVAWLSTRWTSIPTIAFIQVMTVSGSAAIIFCAALQGVGKETIDAAKIDGAGYLRQIRYIYLPAIAPTVALLAMIITMGSMQIFEWIYMLAQHNGAITFMYNIYAEAFIYSRHGLAAAESVILVFIIGFFAFLQRRFQTWQNI